MPEFIYTLRPARAEMPFDPTPEEQEAIGQHWEYVLAATQAGKIIAGGRTTEPPDIWGLIIFEAADLAEAEAFMNADPGVSSGVQIGKVEPFRLALLGSHPPRP